MEGGSNLWGAGFINCIVVVVVVVVVVELGVMIHQYRGQ